MQRSLLWQASCIVDKDKLKGAEITRLQYLQENPKFITQLCEEKDQVIKYSKKI